MKKAALTFIAAYLISILGNYTFCQQPNLEWVKQAGGPQNDYARSVAVDGAGNIYTTGAFQGTADFDPGPETFILTAEGFYNTFILKLDAEGNFVWAKQLFGTEPINPYSIAVDDSGNVVTTGYFWGTIDFDPGVDSLNLTSNGWEDVFILKLDSAGDLVWAKTMGGDLIDWGLSITTDASGNVYTAGFFSETADLDPGPGTLNYTAAGDDDLFVQKLDASGDLVWVKHIGGESYDDPFTIEVDASGNVYFAGLFGATVDFDPGPGAFYLTAISIFDIFVEKLDASGNFVWAKQMMGTVRDQAHSIKVDALGNVYTTGYFQDSVDFDPGPDTFKIYSAGHRDAFVQKLDPEGELIWIKRMGGLSLDEGIAIALDGQGNVYTTGHFWATADLDPGLDSLNFNSLGDEDIYIQKLDPSGDLIWTQQIGGIGSDIVRGLVVDTSDNIYITGSFEDTVDFDPGPDFLNLSSAGERDLFVHKMNQCSLTASISSDQGFELCGGESTVLTVTGGDSYLWNTGDTTASILVSPTVSTIYIVTITDSIFGCSITDLVQITVESTPIAQFDFTITDSLVSFINLSSSNAQTFSWNFGDNSTSADIDPSHIFSENGSYTIQLIVSNECGSDTISQNIEVIFTGTKNIVSKILITVFPNPVTNILTIKSEIEIDNIQISNALGQKVLELKTQKSIEQIDVSNLQSGIYSVHFLIGEVIFATEFVKL